MYTNRGFLCQQYQRFFVFYCFKISGLTLFNNNKGDPDYEMLVYIMHIIDITEYIVVIFFLIEYLVRLITCPRKIKFFFGLMNLIDFLALIPFFLSLLLEGLEDFEIVGKTGKIIRLIRVMRILRKGLII